MIDVVKLSESVIDLLHLPYKSQPFELIGRFIPAYDGEKWSYSEILYDKDAEKKTKTYDDDRFNPYDFIDREERAVFLAIRDNICVGYIKVVSDILNKGYIADLAVDSQYRHQGIGTKLMDGAVAWCRERKFSGITLETQDVNLQACRFYIRYGFELSGLNTKKYALSEYENEIALYFYLKL